MAGPPRTWTADPDRLEQALVRAQKTEALGRIAGGVAHDLNNPLTAIVAFSDLLRRDARLPPDLHDDAELLVQEAQRTRRLVQDLLDFARRRPPERRPTSLRALVDSVLTLQAHLFLLDRVSVEVEVAPDLPPAAVDRGELQQALLNLTLNAVEAIRSRGGGGRLDLRGATDGRALTLEIADDGPGIAAEHRGRIFEPFFTTRDPGESSGLGLPVAALIAERHGGWLRHLTGDGPGTTFVLHLPLDGGEEGQDRG